MRTHVNVVARRIQAKNSHQVVDGPLQHVVDEQEVGDELRQNLASSGRFRELLVQLLESQQRVSLAQSRVPPLQPQQIDAGAEHAQLDASFQMAEGRMYVLQKYGRVVSAAPCRYHSVSRDAAGQRMPIRWTERASGGGTYVVS